MKGFYIVTEASCIDPTAGAWRHISIGIEELSKHFEIKPLLPQKSGEYPSQKSSARRPLKGFRNSKIFGVFRDFRDFAKNLRIALGFFKVVRKAQPDFCYCRANFFDPLPLILKLTRTCRVFIEANGLQFETRSSRFRSALSWVHKMFERWVYKKADYVFFVGTYGDYWNLPGKNWINVENGVEREFVESFTQHRKQIGEKINLCVIARVIGHHQIEILADAIKLLSLQERKKIKLHLFGTGFESVKASLKGVIEMNDHGFTARRELAEGLKTMHVGFITGVPDFQSQMKLFDYGAAKLLAIVPASHNLKCWFRNNEVCFFIPGNAQSLSQKISSLCSEGDKDGRGETLYKRILNEFLWETVFERKATIIKSVCSQ